MPNQPHEPQKPSSNAEEHEPSKARLSDEQNHSREHNHIDTDLLAQFTNRRTPRPSDSKDTTNSSA
jgi:hypothetical protein